MPNEEVRTLKLGYTPHVFQVEAHTGMKRFSILVCHRRWGKTVFAIMCLINDALKCARPNPFFGYVAPFRNQAKAVAWKYLTMYTRSIPGIRVNETELEITFPHNKAAIRLFGADNADAMRGLYFDGVVLDEVADMKPYVWGEVVAPALSDRQGWALFIGTPKGMNLFFELYNTGLSNPDRWYVGFYPVDKTIGKLPQLKVHDIDVMRDILSDAQFRQEYMCDFNASCDNALITIDLAARASEKYVNPSDFSRQPLIFGIDVARFGSDSTVIQRRQGLCASPPEILRKLDNMTVAGIIARRIDAENPDAVFIDSGRGEGVIDRLRQLNFTVSEVNFNGRACDDKHYSNRRAEMWDGIRKWLTDGGCLPADPALRRDLVIPTYMFDASDRMKLEAKEDIKKRTGASPDRADALALTFAEPVAGSRGGADAGVFAPRFANNRLVL